VYDGSPRALRQRTVNFAAKRFADMMYVSGRDRAQAERHFRWRAAVLPSGLSGRPTGAELQDKLNAAVSAGRISIDYALTATHTGTSYAACFRTNIDRRFPDLPTDTAWASGASDQRIFILRRHNLTVAVANETDHPMDLSALNRLIATAITSIA
jgi:hypothetical protein